MKTKAPAIGTSMKAAVIRLRRAFWWLSAVSIRWTMSWSVPNAAMLPRVAPITAEKSV